MESAKKTRELENVGLFARFYIRFLLSLFLFLFIYFVFLYDFMCVKPALTALEVEGFRVVATSRLTAQLTADCELQTALGAFKIVILH